MTARNEEVDRRRAQARRKQVPRKSARLRRTHANEGMSKAEGIEPETGQKSRARVAAHGKKLDFKRFLRTYGPDVGFDALVSHVHRAEPLQRVELERRGVPGRFVKDLAKTMDIPAVRMFYMIGIPKATAEKKSAAGELVAGSGGQAALGMARLVGVAREIVDNSTAAEAQGFDAAKWLGRWLERPQPALGGRKPATLLDTPTGVEIVVRLLGAIESGSYQ